MHYPDNSTEHHKVISFLHAAEIARFFRKKTEQNKQKYWKQNKQKYCYSLKLKDCAHLEDITHHYWLNF